MNVQECIIDHPSSPLLYIAHHPSPKTLEYLRVVAANIGEEAVFPVRVLISYANWYNRKRVEVWRMIGRPLPGEVEVFVDSGGFSLYTRNLAIDVEGYVDFLHHAEEDLRARGIPIVAYANLDVRYSQEATRRNYSALRKAGLTPLPVLPLGRALEELRWYQSNDSREIDYVAVGSIVKSRNSTANRLLETVRDVVKHLAAEGICAHLFGVGGVERLKRVWAYSTDATSFVATRYGNVLLLGNEGSLRYVKLGNKSEVFRHIEPIVAQFGLPIEPFLARYPSKDMVAVIIAFEIAMLKRAERYLAALWRVRAKKWRAINAR